MSTDSRWDTMGHCCSMSGETFFSWIVLDIVFVIATRKSHKEITVYLIWQLTVYSFLYISYSVYFYHKEPYGIYYFPPSWSVCIFWKGLNSESAIFLLPSFQMYFVHCCVLGIPRIKDFRLGVTVQGLCNSQTRYKLI